MSETLKYVSAKAGHLVPRYGTQQQIGARIVRAGEVVFLEREVVALTDAEWNAHVKEYSRLKAAGILVERSKADLDAWEKLELEREARELADRKKAEAAEAEAAAKEAAKADAPSAETTTSAAASPAPDTKFGRDETPTTDETTKRAKGARGER